MDDTSLKLFLKKKSRLQALHGYIADVVQLKQRINDCIIKTRKTLAGLVEKRR